MRRRPARSTLSPFDLVSYAMAALLLASAVVVLEGSLFPDTLKQARLVFGTVLLLLGIYRIVVATARRRMAREEERMAELRAQARAEVHHATESADRP